MNLQDWWHLLVKQILETGLLVWISVLLSVAEVLFAKANKIWLYPTGIAGTLLAIYILFVAGLFSECLLNGYYVVMSIYGWWYWVRKKNSPPVNITYCTAKEWLQVIVFTIGVFVLLDILLKKFTSSTVPLMDAWVSATAWVGMWLLAKRKIENWILLNISNIFAIPLLFYKQLALYSVLTIFLFIVAIFGYIEWRKIVKGESINAAPAIG